jgi:hypothetical protein
MLCAAPKALLAAAAALGVRPLLLAPPVRADGVSSLAAQARVTVPCTWAKGNVVTLAAQLAAAVDGGEGGAADAEFVLRDGTVAALSNLSCAVWHLAASRGECRYRQRGGAPRHARAYVGVLPAHVRVGDADAAAPIARGAARASADRGAWLA